MREFPKTNASNVRHDEVRYKWKKHGQIKNYASIVYIFFIKTRNPKHRT